MENKHKYDLLRGNAHRVLNNNIQLVPVDDGTPTTGPILYCFQFISFCYCKHFKA